MLGKTHEMLIDYTAAFDSPVRDRVYAAISELGIPAKLISQCRMNSCSSVKIGRHLSETFDTVHSFRKAIPYYTTSASSSRRVVCKSLDYWQWHYFSKNFCCVRRRHSHHRTYQTRCYCCI